MEENIAERQSAADELLAIKFEFEHTNYKYIV
jgi:hypothetical protein